MAKYIDANKLNAEIDRLYNGEAPKHDQQCNFDDGYFTGIRVISRLINFLQKEQPEPDKKEQSQIDWESEIEEYWIASGWSKSISLGKFKVIARYFIGLTLNAKKEE